MTFKLTIRPIAFGQLQILKKGDKNAYLKCFDLILSVIDNPFEGIGKPERLKGFGEICVYSRRINDKDRLIYNVFDDIKTIEILSCQGHYDDH